MALNLGTAWIQISPSTKGLRSEIEKVLGEVNPAPASKKISSGLSGAFATVAKVGAGAMATVAAAAAGIGAAVAGVALKGGISRALNIEQATAKLAGLGHSTESVAQLMDNATTAVKGTAYGLDEAATVAAQFAAVGIGAGKDMTDVLTTVADTAQISGRSFTDIGTIFSSVAAKGKLDGQDMLQLTSSGVPVLQFLSKQLGVTTSDVSAMVSSGKIDFQTFASAMQSGLGGSAQAAGTTFSGALANVQAALSRLGASAATPALEALRILFIGLIPVIDDVTAGLKPAMDALGPQLAQAAEQAVGAFGGLGEVLGQSIAAAMPAVSQALVGLIGLLPTIIGALGQIMPPLIEAGAQVLPALVQAAITLTPVIVQIVALVAQFLPSLVQMGMTVLPAIVSAVTAVLPAIVSVVSAVAGFISSHQTLVMSVLAAVAAFVGVRSAITGVVSVVGTVKTAVTGLFTALSANPIMLVVAAIAALVAGLIYAYRNSETFRNVVNGVFGAVKDFVVGAFNHIKDAVSAVADWFTGTLVPIFQAVWDGIQVGLDFLKNVFTTAWEGIKVAVAIALTPMQLAWEGMVALWQNVLAPALTWLWQTVFQPAWQGIQAVVQAVADWFTGTLVPVLQAVWDAISAALSWLWRTIFQPVWNGIKSTVQAVASWFTGTLVPVLQSAWNAISNAISWLKNRFSDIWNGIKNNVVQPVVNWFTGTVISRFVSVKDNVVRAFEAMRDGIGNAWNAIKELAAKPVRFVVNTVVAKVVDAYNTVASKFGADTVNVPHVDFWSGGYTGPGGRKDPAGVVHKGEVVWSQDDVARWGGARVVDAMRRWRGYDKGGVVGDSGGGTSLSDILKGLVKGPVEFFKNLIGGLMDGLGSSSFVQAIKGIPPAIAEMIGKWVKDHMATFFGGPSGSAAFDGWWEAAVAIIPEMAPYKSIAATVARMESGFNPSVVNNWDSNAKAGHPSAGLMQFIQPTFAAYHHPGFDNWMGAIDQLLAWWHYVNARYGGPMNIPGIVSMAGGGGYVGYAKGTSHARRGLAWVGENGPELVRFRGGEQVIPNDRLGGAGDTYVFSPRYDMEGRSVRRDFEDFQHQLGKVV